MRLVLKSPLKTFRINQAFGQNFNDFYRSLGLLGHNGLDLFALDGDGIYASHDGRVTFTGYDGAGGLGIVIRTEEKFDYYDPTKGESPTYYKTIYWHLEKDSIVVTAGETVKAGQLIAKADNTGRSTGTHLHFGLKPIYRGEKDWEWWNAEQDNGYAGAIDPLPFFEKIPEVPTLTKTLRKGDRGDQVKILQQQLNDKNNAGLVVDGVFGRLTDSAVKNFQFKMNIAVDGIVGPVTREWLAFIIGLR